MLPNSIEPSIEQCIARRQHILLLEEVRVSSNTFTYIAAMVNVEERLNIVTIFLCYIDLLLLAVLEFLLFIHSFFLNVYVFMYVNV